jgi:hypothetical protein
VRSDNNSPRSASCASKRRDGRLVVVTGRSRTGKSRYVAGATAGARRLLVYDPKGDPRDYPGTHATRSPRALAGALAKAAAGPGRYRLIDTGAAHFERFCATAIAWGVGYGPIVVVADELAEVTSPGKAPRAWGRLVRQGLGFGIDIYAITQRPAESDKTTIGAFSEWVTFGLQRRADRTYVAGELDLDPAQIAALRPLHGLAVIPGGRPRPVRVGA